MAIAIILLFLIIVLGAMSGSKHLPKRAQISVIVVFSTLFAFLHSVVAKSQLDTIGFAAGNRAPDHPAEIIGYMLAILAFINIFLVFKRVRYAAILLGVLIVVFPIMYFISL